MAGVPWLPMWRAVAVGFMANNILPARAGEVARAWILSRGAPVRMSSALASIVMERVFDTFAIIGLMSFALVSDTLPADVLVGGMPVRRLAATVGAVFAALLLVMLLVAWRPGPWLAALDGIGRRLLPERFAAKLADVGRGLVDGLSVLRAPGRLPGVAAWSLVLWLVNAAAFWLGFRALHLDLPFEAALLMQGLIAFGIAIPSSPGFFGVFEAVAIVALGFYGVDKDHAVSYAIVYHITTFIPITLLGLQALAQSQARLSDLREAPAA